MKIMNLMPFNFGQGKNVNNKYKSQYQMPVINYKNNPEGDTFIKSKVEETKTTQPDKYENLSNIQDKIPRTMLGQRALKNYLEDEADYDTFLKQLSIAYITNILKDSRSYDFDSYENIMLLEKQLEDGTINPNDYEMVLELAEEGKVHPDSLTFNKVNNRFNKQFANDVDKIFEARANNQVESEVFVPKFKSAKAAQAALETGGVCAIEDKDNISMKLKDGSLKELFITPETYLELFPPAQRYGLAQGSTGDCFLISSFNSAYLNPNSRHLVLEMFKENSDGTLDVSIGGFKEQKGKAVPKNPRSYVAHDVQNIFSPQDVKDNFKKYVSQSEGFRVLEAVAREGSENRAYERIKNRFNIYQEALPYLQNDNDCMEMYGQKYSKKEMQTFVDLIVDIDDKDSVLQTMVSAKDMFFDLDFDVETAQEILGELQYTKAVNDDMYIAELEYFIGVLERQLDFAIRNNKDSIRLDFLPSSCFNDLLGRPQSDKIDYIEGGNSSQVYRQMGLKTQVIKTDQARRQNEKKLNQAFSDPDFDSKYLANVASFNNKKSRIIQGHAYSLKQNDDKDDKRTFVFTNPHNGAKETPLTPHQLKKAFTEFEFAMLED